LGAQHLSNDQRKGRRNIKDKIEEYQITFNPHRRIFRTGGFGLFDCFDQDEQ
jgi:hypothetical protein